ncbi:MAG: hypothetical protein COV45_09315 [Deltaproteobacteria bacterium CG11_big_fil_rev_8_21_14_0_20_47_16]|nr:MAG: hypothetical protein COV45_09315 [Deltaproteobacteria bacterium CG11_big_fil_rev_8_21_14_0_20_47_16]
MNLFIVILLSLGMTACGAATSSTSSGNSVQPSSPQTNASASKSVCNGVNDFTNIPSAFLAALKKYTTTNAEHVVNVCTEDSNSDGAADYIVVESTDQPNHESVYYDDSDSHHEDYDFNTNEYRYSDLYTDQTPGSAGNNMIEAQSIVMRMPINPASATTKTATTYNTIGLGLNGVSFFNENAGPGDDITDELFTFDQCSGHPQQDGVYHYHVGPICLIRDLGGAVVIESKTVKGKTYTWIDDAGTNAGLLLGFLMDGFPVYGPIGTSETDCNGSAVSTPIDDYNGHTHCTADFGDAIYHYHVKTANKGGTSSPIFWITNEYYYGTPGSVSN